MGEYKHDRFTSSFIYEDQYTSIYPVKEQFEAYALLKEYHGYKSDKCHDLAKWLSHYLYLLYFLFWTYYAERMLWEPQRGKSLPCI